MRWSIENLFLLTLLPFETCFAFFIKGNLLESQNKDLNKNLCESRVREISDDEVAELLLYESLLPLNAFLFLIETNDMAEKEIDAIADEIVFEGVKALFLSKNVDPKDMQSSQPSNRPGRASEIPQNGNNLIDNAQGGSKEASDFEVEDSSQIDAQFLFGAKEIASEPFFTRKSSLRDENVFGTSRFHPSNDSSEFDENLFKSQKENFDEPLLTRKSSLEDDRLFQSSKFHNSNDSSKSNESHLFPDSTSKVNLDSMKSVSLLKSPNCSSNDKKFEGNLSSRADGLNPEKQFEDETDRLHTDNSRNGVNHSALILSNDSNIQKQEGSKSGPRGFKGLYKNDGHFSFEGELKNLDKNNLIETVLGNGDSLTPSQDDKTSLIGGTAGSNPLKSYLFGENTDSQNMHAKCSLVLNNDSEVLDQKVKSDFIKTVPVEDSTLENKENDSESRMEQIATMSFNGNKDSNIQKPEQLAAQLKKKQDLQKNMSNINPSEDPVDIDTSKKKEKDTDMVFEILKKKLSGLDRKLLQIDSALREDIPQGVFLDSNSDRDGSSFLSTTARDSGIIPQGVLLNSNSDRNGSSFSSTPESKTISNGVLSDSDLKQNRSSFSSTTPRDSKIIPNEALLDSDLEKNRSSFSSTPESKIVNHRNVGFLHLLPEQAFSTNLNQKKYSFPRSQEELEHFSKEPNAPNHKPSKSVQKNTRQSTNKNKIMNFLSNIISALKNSNYVAFHGNNLFGKKIHPNDSYIQQIKDENKEFIQTNEQNCKLDDVLFNLDHQENNNRSSHRENILFSPNEKNSGKQTNKSESTQPILSSPNEQNSGPNVLISSQEQGKNSESSQPILFSPSEQNTESNIKFNSQDKGKNSETSQPILSSPNENNAESNIKFNSQEQGNDSESLIQLNTNPSSNDVSEINTKNEILNFLRIFANFSEKIEVKNKKLQHAVEKRNKYFEKDKSQQAKRIFLETHAKIKAFVDKKTNLELKNLINIKSIHIKNDKYKRMLRILRRTIIETEHLTKATERERREFIREFGDKTKNTESTEIFELKVAFNLGGAIFAPNIFLEITNNIVIYHKKDHIDKAVSRILRPIELLSENIRYRSNTEKKEEILKFLLACLEKRSNKLFDEIDDAFKERSLIIEMYLKNSESQQVSIMKERAIDEFQEEFIKNLIKSVKNTNDDFMENFILINNDIIQEYKNLLNTGSKNSQENLKKMFKTNTNNVKKE